MEYLRIELPSTYTISFGFDTQISIIVNGINYKCIALNIEKNYAIFRQESQTRCEAV